MNLATLQDLVAHATAQVREAADPALSREQIEWAIIAQVCHLYHAIETRNGR